MENITQDAQFREAEASLERAGRVDELIRLYEGRARQLPVHEEASRMLFRAGELARDRQKDLPRAEALFRRAALAAPGRREPLIGLKALLESRQDAQGLAETLERLAALCTGADAGALWLRAADLYEQKLSRRERAMLCFQSATRADPEAPEAWERLLSLLFGERRLEAAFDCLERLRASSPGSAKPGPYVALAELTVDDPPRHALGQRALEVALALSPEDGAAQGALAALTSMPEVWRTRVRELRQASQEERDRKQAAWLSLAVARLHLAYDPQAKAKLHDALDRCFLLWPAMPDAVSLLVCVAEAEGNVMDAEARLGKMARATKERHAQAELFLALGGLRLTRLNDTAGALEAYLAAGEAEPSRPDAANLAAELLIDAGKVADAVALYERHLGALRDRQAEISLRLRLARLCQSELRAPEQAQRHLEAALALEATSANASFELCRILAEAEDADGVGKHLELALMAPRPVKERVALCESAALLEEERDDPAAALDALCRALAIDPGNESLVQSARAYADQAGAHRAFADALQRAAHLAGEAAATRLWRQLAQLLASPLAAPEEAVAAWGEVLKSAPEDEEALVAVAALERSLPVAAQAGAGAAAGEPPGQRAANAPLDDLAQARAALAASPEDLTLLQKVGALAASSEDWALLAEVTQTLARVSEDAAAARAWKSRLAHLYAERLDRPEDAAALYLGLVEDGETGAELTQALERLQRTGVREAEIASALVRLYGQSGDHPRQAGALLVQLGAATGPKEQKRLATALAELHERHLLDGRGALGFYGKALAADPHDEGLRQAAIRLGQELGAERELVRLLLDVGARAQDPDIASAAFGEAADFAEGAELAEESVRALQSALMSQPGSHPLFTRLLATLRRQKKLAEAEELLSRRVDREQGAARAELYALWSEVKAEAGRPQEAAALLEQAVSAGFDRAEGLGRLVALYEQAGQMDELAQALSRQVVDLRERGDEDAAARLSLRRAQVLEASLGDRQAAVKNYRELLEQRPSDPDALAALEGLLEDPEGGLEAARALVPAWTAQNEHRKLVATLERIAQLAPQVGEKVDALGKAAEVHLVHLRQPEMAFAALARAVALTPSDLALRARARQAAEDGDLLAEYAEQLEELVEGAEERALKISLKREMAELYEKKLQNRDGAISELRGILTLEPSNGDALRALQRLHRAQDEWAALAEVLEQLAHAAEAPSDRIAAFREAAALHEEKLGDPESAQAAWRRIAEGDALDREAATALDRLYVELNRPEDLAFALELRRAQEGQGPKGRDLTFRLAQLRHERLSDGAGALSLYRQILEGDAAHPGAREALEALARSEDPLGASALEILDPALARTKEHARRVAIREARLLFALSSERAALEAEIRRISEVDMGQPELAFMSALKAFAQDGSDRTALQPELERLAKVTGSFDELAEIYESAADELEPGDPQLLGLLRRAAELREHLGEVDEATRLWKFVLEEAPQDKQALSQLSKLYAQSQNARNLSEVYAKQAQLAADPAEKAALLAKAAQAYEEAGDDAGAIEAWQSVLALGPDVPALQALDRIFGRLKRHEDACEVLRQLAALTEAPGDKADLLARRAQLLEALEAHADAVDEYAAVLGHEPTHPAAISGLERLLSAEAVRVRVAELLEPVYRSGNDTRRLCEVLDVRLSVATDERRVPLLGEVAVLRESLGEKQLAFAARLRAFVDAPSDAQVRGELERLAADTGAFEELAAAYEDRLERGADEALTLYLWKALGTIYGERLSREDLAARALEEVAKRLPKDLTTLDALARIYKKRSAFRELVHVMRRQVGAQPNVEEQVNILYELGGIAEEQLGDRDIAAKCYGAILDRKPQDANAFGLLGRVLQASERFEELAALFEREIQLAGAQNAQELALELRVRLGRLRISRLDDPRGGLELFKEVLRMKPQHAGAVGALEELARSESPLRGEAATALEPVFADGGDHLKLVQMLESRASSEPRPQEKAALLRRMAELYSGQLDSPEQAFITASRALRELPDDGEALQMCLAWAKPADAEEALTEILEEVAPRATSPQARAALYRALAQLKEREGEAAFAIEAWRRVLEAAPQDAEALGTIGRLLEAENRGGELLEVLKRQLAQTEDGAQRADLLFQMGCLQADSLGDKPSALTTFRRLLEVRPEDARTLTRLDALCEELGRWPELADVLSRRLELARDDASLQDALRFRLGQVREAKLHDRVGALDLYTELLAKDARHEGALGRVEALVEREPQNLTASDVLLRAYREQGNAAKLAELLEARASASVDGDERKAFLVELGNLRLDGQDEPELAFMAYMRAFRDDPNDADVRALLERSADAAKAWDELAGVYEEDLPRIAEAQDAALLCLKLGHLCDVRLGEPERAVGWYERARTLSPEVWEGALPQLDKLYNQLSRGEEMAEVLSLLAQRAKDPHEQVGYLFRLGQIAQEILDSPDRAADAYQQILELDPSHLASARLLEELYEELGHADRLLKVLEHLKDRVQGAERERVLNRMAQVSAESMGDFSSSIAIYRDLLARNPRNEQAFAALESLLEKGGHHEELRALLSQKLSATIDPRELVRLNDRLGRVVWKLEEKPEEAVPYFKAALERDARHKGALEALRDIFESTAKSDDLVVILRRLVPLAEDAGGVKALRIRLAELLCTMNRREEALDAGRRALEVEPHTPAELDRVLPIFTQLRAFPDAVRTLELRAEAELGSEQNDAAVGTLFEVVELWRGPAQKPESAGAVLERILELDPANRKAYEQAREHFSKHKDWRAYAQVTDRYLPHLVTDEERLNTLRELAGVQEGKLGQKDTAFLTWCRALQQDASVPQVREEVERLAEETGSFDELAAVYEQVADDLPRGPLAEKLYAVLAKVQDEKLDDPAAAEAALRKILEFDPTNSVALDALAQMFARRGRNKEHIVALEQQLEAAGGIEARKEILLQISRVFDERLSDPAEAAAALERALELEADPQTLGTLVELYRRQKAHAQAASTLIRWRDLCEAPEERARLQAEVAQIYERDLEDDEAAIEGYRQALEFDPTHRDALASLERLYTKLDRPADLLAVYERQIEVTADWREKVKVLFKSAGIWEDKYQNLANADACVEGVLSLDPQNLQAIRGLERLRRAQERWEDLIGVLEHHVGLATTPGEQSELCVQMGEVWHQQLRQVDRAVANFHRALELNPQNREAMHSLGNLYERSGNWPFALDMMGREAEVLGATPEAVELYHRMGKINEDMLLDPASARAAYEAALRIDPGYLPCIRALKGIHEIEKDWDAYQRALVQEATQTEDPEAKSRAYIEVARFFGEKKEDRDEAQRHFEEALKHVPDAVEAARPLADIYVAKEEWAGAEKMLDIVAVQMARRAEAEADEGLARELCRQLYRLGYVSEKLGKKEKALGAYEKAWQLDATYLPALEGLGNLLVQHQRFDEALKVYQTILIHHRDDLTDLEVVEIYWQLGDIQVQVGQGERALNHFEKALAIDPGHDPSLRSLIALAEAGNDWEKSAQHRHALVAVLEGEQRFEACVELGRLAKDKLSDPFRAIDAYLAAHKLQPLALDVMDALYVLYRETRQGQKAAEILEKMLGSEELRQSPRIKRVWFALGEICRDELREYDRAAMAFNAALDADPRFVEAFAALEAMLGEQGQWRALEDNYARMIQRLPKTPDTHQARMHLWRALGDLYRQVLKDPQNAFLAYQAVSRGLPEDVTAQETYAELATALPGQETEALAAWRRALPGTSQPGKVVHALVELHGRRKAYDEVWLAAQVAQGLIGEVGKHEEEVLRKLAPYAKKREQAQQPLTDRLWRSHLFHPRVRGPIADVMAILFDQVGHHFAAPHAQYQLNPRKHRIDVAGSPVLQVHQYRYVSRLLGMEAVELYSPYLVATLERMEKRSNDPAPEPLVGVEICHTHPVCLKVGGRFFPRDTNEVTQKELLYQLGRTFALLRPELALSQRLAAEKLEALLQAAISLSQRRFRFTADMRAIEEFRKLLEKSLTAQAHAALAREVAAYVASAQADDLKHYLEGAELTALRAGLLVAGEVEPVKRMVAGETGSAYRVQPRTKIRDLMVFALSEDLHALRVAVGTQVDPTAAAAPARK